MSQRLERLVNLLAALIDTRRPLARDEIFTKVPGYSGNAASMRRAFERDKETLRQIGVPIKTAMIDARHDEQSEGYFVTPDDYYLPDPGLTHDELSAFAVAASSIKLSENDARRALWKLGADTDQDSSEQKSTREVVKLPDNDRLESILEARRNRRSLTFTYNATTRRVDPHRLTLRNGHWYVTGLDHLRNDIRTYRLDRIPEPIVMGEPGDFEAPKTSSKPWLAAWEMGDEEPLDARLRIDSSQAPLAVDLAGAAAVEEELADGSVILKLKVTNSNAVIGFAFDFLEHCEVLSPPQLRDSVIQRIEELPSLATTKAVHQISEIQLSEGRA